MAQSFEGKTVLITGAGSGIGKATAHKLHALGATLVLCDINPDSLEKLEPNLESDPPAPRKYIYRRCDVSLPADCEAVVNSIPAQNTTATATATTPTDGAGSADRKLDHLFNCAGINPTHIPIAEVSDAYFTRLMDVNVRGTFNMTRACIPLLRRSSSPSSPSSIVNTASTAGLRGTGGYSVYCATKHAIWDPVAPGPIDTPTMAGNVAGGDANERFKKGEVADMVVFLFSGASSFVNGAVVEVTGGMK
ncbi:hypothetical protein BJX64DRAFT_280909 [Aspergillus heterothallicus]